MRWETENNVLLYPSRHIPTTQIVTKKEILQHTSRIYDPWIYLVQLQSEQSYFCRNYGNKSLNGTCPYLPTLKSSNLITDLNSLTTTMFPRYYYRNTSRSTNNTCIHIFCDTSMLSYGDICRDNYSSLMMSKTVLLL